MKDKKALRLLATVIEQIAEAKNYNTMEISLARLAEKNNALAAYNRELLSKLYRPSDEERLHGHNTGTGAEK
jgi:hypothetical protein